MGGSHNRNTNCLILHTMALTQCFDDVHELHCHHHNLRDLKEKWGRYEEMSNEEKKELYWKIYNIFVRVHCLGFLDAAFIALYPQWEHISSIVYDFDEEDDGEYDDTELMW